MLFVLGVVVGKRIESRGVVAETQIDDPLALLDQVADEVSHDDVLTFPETLMGEAAARVEPSPGLSGGNDSTREGDASISNHGPVSRHRARDEHSVSEDRIRQTGANMSPTTSRPTPRQEHKVAQGRARAGGAEKATGRQVRVFAPPAASMTKKMARKQPNQGADTPKVGRFTLQISSFQDRQEAAALAQKYQDLGAFVVTSEVGDRGTWYRVRLGGYDSMDEALRAKKKFERKYKQIAYVAPR